MTHKIKFLSKSEWLEFERPLAEPDAFWIEGEPYKIERREDTETITWYGRLMNWVKGVNEWTMLTKNGFVPCEPPIYETLYQEYLKSKEL